jgi:farnesyl-diphosphate farnesyltransferase
MSPQEAADVALRETSRTFYIPIIRLPSCLRAAVTSAYLCFRAIDEIEDHPTLTRESKVNLLRGISSTCKAQDPLELDLLLRRAKALPDVTRRICEWISLAPKDVADGLWQANAQMSQSMAQWVNLGWQFGTRVDLDHYTYSVAGAVGVFLSDLWEWFDGTQCDRSKAISFGRGLQAVNILRNREEDQARGVNLFPSGWNRKDLSAYAKENLSVADEYLAALPCGPAKEFCRLPLVLAHATLAAMDRGENKLSRDVVLTLVGTEDCAPCEKPKVPFQNSRRQFQMSEIVVVVDEQDHIIGVEEKMTAHRLGIPHRAFSIFILNSRAELLLQKRAKTKYHSAGQWSNTCCGHPRLSESIQDAGRRRLKEEMGIDSPVGELFAFRYRAELENGLIENEYDHVLVGQFDGSPQPNPGEVEAWKWMSLRAVQSDALKHPEEYTCWFKTAIHTLCAKLATQAIDLADTTSSWHETECFLE